MLTEDKLELIYLNLKPEVIEDSEEETEDSEADAEVSEADAEVSEAEEEAVEVSTPKIKLEKLDPFLVSKELKRDFDFCYK